MKLSDIKAQLPALKELIFKLPSGKAVPRHFHVTEVGVVTKHFIDCGGTVRKEQVANFQLWEADDFDHRLAPQKLTDIITLAEKTLEMEDLEVEVEYQGETIGKYGLGFDGKNFLLTNKLTDCLARDKCVVPEPKAKINIAQLGVVSNTCTPGGGCC